jgi:hypothetical protein
MQIRHFSMSHFTIYLLNSHDDIEFDIIRQISLKLKLILQISTIDEFFSWLNDTAIVNLFPDNHYTGERLPWRVRQFMNDGSNFRVGPPRLRQMRTIKKSAFNIINLLTINKDIIRFVEFLFFNF